MFSAIFSVPNIYENIAEAEKRQKTAAEFDKFIAEDKRSK